MAKKDSWYNKFREAYMDLHAAYLAVLRLRHQRHDSLPLVIERDMNREDPFGKGNPAAKDAVKRWHALWEKHACGDANQQAFSAVTDALKQHYHSWSEFMKTCPPDLKKFKIDVPYDTYMMTATTMSRGTLEKRARVLSEAWKRHITKGTDMKPDKGKGR